MQYGVTFAEVFPVDIRSQLLASHSAGTLAFDRDDEALPELLFGGNCFAEIAQARSATAHESFLLR